MIERFLPLTKDGRQSLVYIVFAGCGPALTLTVIWAMRVIRNWAGATDAARLDRFAELAMLLAVALLIITVALACFVSIRAFKASVGKDGVTLDATGEGDGT